MFAIFHCKGKIPSSYDFWKMTLKTGAILPANSFATLGVTPSGPGDLLTLSRMSFSYTESVSKFMWTSFVFNSFIGRSH